MIMQLKAVNQAERRRYRSRTRKRRGCGLFFVGIVWSWGLGVLPAALEPVALAVHLQDVDVMGEPVQQRAGEALRTEALGQLVEGEVGGDQDGVPLVALAEDLEEQFRSGGGQGDRGTKPNSSMVTGTTPHRGSPVKEAT